MNEARPDSATFRSKGWSFAIATAIAAATLVVGVDRLHQGLDLDDQGLWLLGTSIAAEGDRVHANIETGDGALRYWLLLPFYALTGGSVGAWAWLHACVLALLAGGGTLVLLRRGCGPAAALWPLGLLAVTPLSLAASAAVACSYVLHRATEQPRRTGAWILAGAAIAVVTALDLRWAVFVWLAGAALMFTDGRPARRAAVGFVAAAVGSLIALQWLAGFDGAGLRNAWHLPARTIQDHFATGGAARWWVTLDRGFWLRDPFAGLLTGENLDPILPGHSFLRASSVRAMATMALVLPIAWAWRGRGAARALAIATGAGVAWLLLARGDVPSIRDVFLLSLPLGIVVVTRLGPAAKAASTALLALVCLPLAIETLWLVGPGDRDGLMRWGREGAGVDLTAARIDRLEELAATLEPVSDRPILIWPTWPGLHHVLQLPWASRWVTLRGTRPDGERLLAELREADPPAIILAANRSFPTVRMRREVPATWQHLRVSYRIAATALGGHDQFRLLQRLGPDPDELESISLRERVPDIELTVANETSPALRRNLEVGQSFTLGDRDLAGFAVRWSTRGRDLPITLRVRVWQKLGDAYDALLAASTVETTIAGDGARSWFRYPVAETARKDIAITLEAREATSEEVRLYWHRHDAGALDVDLFDEGSALLDRQPVDADLFMIVY